MPPEEIRIDKFLWAVRLYKTRSQASDACRNGKIIINNIHVKPSHAVRKGEIIVVRKMPVEYTFEIVEPTGSRISAKLVSQFINDLTTPAEREKLNLVRSDRSGYRPKGLGRPTKKERRSIDKMNDTCYD